MEVFISQSGVGLERREVNLAFWESCVVALEQTRGEHPARNLKLWDALDGSRTGYKRIPENLCGIFMSLFIFSGMGSEEIRIDHLRPAYGFLLPLPGH
jgi:hypothetical protein